MATKVQQSSVNPTPKLSTAVIVSGSMNILGLIVMNIWPTWYDAAAWGSAETMLIAVLGYYVTDTANIVVNTDA